MKIIWQLLLLLLPTLARAKEPKSLAARPCQIRRKNYQIFLSFQLTFAVDYLLLFLLSFYALNVLGSSLFYFSFRVSPNSMSLSLAFGGFSQGELSMTLLLILKSSLKRSYLFSLSLFFFFCLLSHSRLFETLWSRLLRLVHASCKTLWLSQRTRLHCEYLENFLIIRNTTICWRSQQICSVPSVNRP